MKNHAKILVMIALILGLSGAAKAESQDGIIVKLPFTFVVGAETLPAGTYTMRNASDDPSGPLIITNHDSSTSIFVLPNVIETASTEHPELDFLRGGEEHFLSTIHTAWRTYHLPVSQAAIAEAAAASHNNGSASASSGSE